MPGNYRRYRDRCRVESVPGAKLPILAKYKIGTDYPVATAPGSDSAHDEYAHLDGLVAVKYVRRHDRAMFGECVRKSEVRGQKSEVRSRKSEVRGQRSEVRSQKRYALNALWASAR